MGLAPLQDLTSIRIVSPITSLAAWPLRLPQASIAVHKKWPVLQQQAAPEFKPASSSPDALKRNPALGSRAQHPGGNPLWHTACFSRSSATFKKPRRDREDFVVAL